MVRVPKTRRWDVDVTLQVRIPVYGGTIQGAVAAAKRYAASRFDDTQIVHVGYAAVSRDDNDTCPGCNGPLHVTEALPDGWIATCQTCRRQFHTGQLGDPWEAL